MTRSDAAGRPAIEDSKPSRAAPPQRVLDPQAWKLLLVLVLVGGLALLRWFDPAQHAFFPRCTFHMLTGLECPGCGGQRAVHQLLHGELSAALHANALLVGLLPVGAWLLLRFILARCTRHNLPAMFLNRTALGLFVVALVAFGIARNLPGFEWLRP